MSKIGWSRKLILLLILGTIASHLLILYAVYKQNGYLPKGVVLAVIITCIFICLFILIIERFFRYIMNYETKHNKDDEQ